MKREENTTSVLGGMAPSKAIIKLSVPATLALLAKAVYNLVDTAYIGMLNSDIALTAVGVTVPLLLIMVSIENIFAAGAAVLAGRQLGSRDNEEASRTVTTIIGISVGIGILLCVGGIVFSFSGKGLCILDVCSSACKSSGPEYELCGKSRIFG